MRRKKDTVDKPKGTGLRPPGPGRGHKIPIGSGIPASGIPASGTPGTKHPMFYAKEEKANRDAASARAFAKLVEKLESELDQVVVNAAVQILNRNEGVPVQTVQGKDGGPMTLLALVHASMKIVEDREE